MPHTLEDTTNGENTPKRLIQVTLREEFRDHAKKSTDPLRSVPLNAFKRTVEEMGGKVLSEHEAATRIHESIKRATNRKSGLQKIYGLAAGQLMGLITKVTKNRETSNIYIECDPQKADDIRSAVRTGPGAGIIQKIG